MAKITESPIEEDMLLALMGIGEGGIVLRNTTLERITQRIQEHRKLIVIAPQVRVGPYRADFIVARNQTVIAVECDGAAFHQDWEKDRTRDEYFRKHRIDVMRFAGREIFRDMYDCAHTVMSKLIGTDTRAKDTEFAGDVMARVLMTAARQYGGYDLLADTGERE